MKFQEHFKQFISRIVFLVMYAQEDMRQQNFVLAIPYLTPQMHSPPFPTRGRLTSMD